jgi:hypothetical protein
MILDGRAACSQVQRERIRERVPQGSEAERRRKPNELKPIPADRPVERPRNWSRLLEDSAAPEQTQEIREVIWRSRPLGDLAWTLQTTAQLKLARILRPRGRPAKHDGNGRIELRPSYVPFSPS